jgi:hypothetical protein
VIPLGTGVGVGSRVLHPERTVELSTPMNPDAERPRPEERKGLLFYVVFAWGVGGVLALFTRALVRLAPMAWQPIAEGSLSAMQVGLYAAWIVFNAYGEGYRAFQKSFSPRVVARAYHLASRPRPFQAVFAPAYCLSLFHANRRGLTTAWVMLVVIIGLVALLRITPQPWRGIIDGGVVVALAWGALVIVVFSIRALVNGPPPAKMNLPD